MSSRMGSFFLSCVTALRRFAQFQISYVTSEKIRKIKEHTFRSDDANEFDRLRVAPRHRQMATRHEIRGFASAGNQSAQCETTRPDKGCAVVIHP